MGEFQFWMYKNQVEQCFKPCDMCHTAVPGDLCYDELHAAALANEFPANFSLEDMQAMQSKSGANTTCSRPCEQCRTAVPGDMCHGAVVHAMKWLIWSHPEWYPGLSANSSFEDFQELLHTRNLERCAMPCRGHPGPPTWSALVAQGGLEPAAAPVYFLAAGGQSCTQACAARQLTCSARSLASASSSVAECKRIIESLGVWPQNGGQYPDDNSGCTYHPGQTGWFQVMRKDGEPECSTVNADSERQRVCACTA